MRQESCLDVGNDVFPERPKAFGREGAVEASVDFTGQPRLAIETPRTLADGGPEIDAIEALHHEACPAVH